MPAPSDMTPESLPKSKGRLAVSGSEFLIEQRPDAMKLAMAKRGYRSIGTPRDREFRFAGSDHRRRRWQSHPARTGRPKKLSRRARTPDPVRDNVRRRLRL